MIDIDPPHPATLPPDELLKQCDVLRTRTGGPGGQRRNKVETAIRLTHRPTGITAQAGERREQRVNQRIALRRLQIELAIHARTWPDFDPSDLWQSRRQDQRIVVNPKHEDYPALLAEAMDALYAHRWDPRKAAMRLAVSTSQLIKLVQKEPAALAEVNRLRQERGEHPLR